MNVMLVVTGLGVGGAERVVVDIADYLSDRGHQVCVVYLKGDAITQPRSASVRVIGLHIESVFDVIRALTRQLPRIVKEFKPSVVHTHMFHANILGRLLRLRVRIPRLITTAHNTNEGGRGRMLLYRLTGRLSDVFTNVSVEAVAAFEQAGAVSRGKMIALHNGIAVDRYQRNVDKGRRARKSLGLVDGERMLLCIGSLTEQKDHANLLNAVLQLRGDVSNFVVFIAGQGPLRDALLSSISDMGLDAQVRLLGVRSDVVELLSAADIFVLSSAWEGFPMVVGEAMSCSCPVVATDCGGVAEFLGDLGCLVQPRSSQSLANGLRQVLALSAEDRSKMGTALRARVVELFSLEAAGRKWEGLYSGESCAPRATPLGGDL